jgi:hypothetical protein
MTDPKPMDPADLIRLRGMATGCSEYDGLVDALFADRDYQERRAEQAERERDEALNNVATAHANARDEDDADALLRGWLAGAGDREKTQQWLNGENPWWHEANEDARAVERLQAEVTRLRARVRVQAEDVERVGVTPTKAEAWLESKGWAGTRTRDSARLWEISGAFVWIQHDAKDAWYEREALVTAITGIASYYRRRRVPGLCGLDILDEMAAMQVEPERAANHALDK